MMLKMFMMLMRKEKKGVSFADGAEAMVDLGCFQELEELITNPRKLSKLVLNHIINRFLHLFLLLN